MANSGNRREVCVTRQQKKRELRSVEPFDGCCGEVAVLIMEVDSELCGALLNSVSSGGGECAAQGADSAGLASALQEEDCPRRVVKFVDEVASPRSDHALDSRPDSAISRFLMLRCSHMVQAWHRRAGRKRGRM